MPRKIIFSTGNFHKVHTDDNKKIDSCFKLDKGIIVMQDG